MARILAISSQVVSGYVGLSAIVPALQALGHEVLPLPTIILSNHPGRQQANGTRLDPDVLHRMIDTLSANGRLATIDAVISGYLPSAGHVAAAAHALDVCSHSRAHPLYLCDPVIGDDPKGLYIDAAAASAVRDVLVPRADILTPNRFELSWLSDGDVVSCDTAVAAANKIGRPLTVCTSIPDAPGKLATIAVTESGVCREIVDTRREAPNGTGDLLSAVFLAHYLQPAASLAKALSAAVRTVEDVLIASAGESEMLLPQAIATWRA